MKSLGLLNRLNLISLRKGLKYNSRSLSEYHKPQYKPLNDDDIIDSRRTSQNDDNNK